MSGDRLRVFHDASCPICRAEMEELMRVDQGEQLELIDASADDFHDAEAQADGLDQATLLSAMWVQDERGTWHRGPNAFAEIYRRVGLARMARLWGSRPLRPLVRLGYHLFLLLRPLLAALGADRVVRWLVRREAREASRRANHCRTESD